jgi:hypothetical protein
MVQILPTLYLSLATIWHHGAKPGELRAYLLPLTINVKVDLVMNTEMLPILFPHPENYPASDQWPVIFWIGQEVRTDCG